uniref:Uncharacterized protein n=1 Tax=Solanum tuberosum TaxID=4113 RepID=M1DLG5_SOLTU
MQNFRSCSSLLRNPENSAKGRPTAGPIDPRSDHGPWFRSVDRHPQNPSSEVEQRLTRTDHRSIDGSSVKPIDWPRQFEDSGCLVFSPMRWTPKLRRLTPKLCRFDFHVVVTLLLISLNEIQNPSGVDSLGSRITLSRFRSSAIRSRVDQFPIHIQQYQWSVLILRGR